MYFVLPKMHLQYIHIIYLFLQLSLLLCNMLKRDEIFNEAINRVYWMCEVLTTEQ